MNEIGQSVAEVLRLRGITAIQTNGGALRVSLPSDFGEIEIRKMNDGDTIIGLVGQEWHTHGRCIEWEYGDEAPDAIAGFIQAIYSGDLKMVEYQLRGEAPKRIIQDDLESFLKYQQPGETFRHVRPRIADAVSQGTVAADTPSNWPRQVISLSAQVFA